MLVAAIDVGSPLKMGWATSQGRSGCGDPTDLIADCRFPLRFDPGFSSRSDPGCW